MTVKSPRLAAFETLYKIQQESAYSNLSLDHLPVANGQERAFATALVRGVLERQITLDALVDKFTTGRLKPKVRVLLRMGAYQALYMDKVPVPAAVNETVELAKTVGQGYYGRMINAVLRQIRICRIRPCSAILCRSPCWLCGKRPMERMLRQRFCLISTVVRHYFWCPIPCL